MFKLLLSSFALVLSISIFADDCARRLSTYDSIKPSRYELSSKQYTIQTFSDEIDGTTQYLSEVIDQFGSLKGRVRTAISNDRTELVFVSADLRYLQYTYDKVDSVLNIKGITPLIPKRGVPTSTLIRLHHMRLHGVPYGGLHQARTSEITNLQTALELRLHPLLRDWFTKFPNQLPPRELLAKAVLTTGTGRYMSAVLNLSGHEIYGVRMEGGQMQRRDWIASDFHYDDPKLKPLLVATKDTDLLPVEFKIVFYLRPY